MTAHVHRVQDDGRLETVRIRATFSHGQPLDFTVDDAVMVPPGFLGDDEYLLRVIRLGPDRFGLNKEDLLTVDGKTAFASGQLVLAEVDSRVYLGYWHVRREHGALFGSDMRPIHDGAGLQILGAVTLITRISENES